MSLWDFPGGPVVKTLHIQGRSHMSYGTAKEKKNFFLKVGLGMGREIPDAIIEVPETKSTSGLIFLLSFFFFFLFVSLSLALGRIC